MRCTLQIFECDFDGCNKTFKHKSYLIRHENIHLGKNFICVWPQCKFVTKHSLRKHSFIHSEVKKFICHWNQCFVKFRHKENLISHKNSVHLKIKNFKSKYNGCNQRFSNKYNLKIHLRVRSEEKLFVCSLYII